MDFYVFLKMLAAQLLMPVPIAFAFFIIGVVTRIRLRYLGNGFIWLAVLFLGLLSWAPVADRLLVPFESMYEPLHVLPSEYSIQAVMVLGGGYQPNQPWVETGQISDASANRLLEGLRLWYLQKDVVLVVSGASRRSEVEPMAWAYARIAYDVGVPETSVLVLDNPRDTAEEARQAVKSLGEGSALLLVTSASHMPRAMRYFHDVGLKPIAAPTHYLALRDDINTLAYWIPSARHLRKSERAFYEFMGSMVNA